MIKPRSKFYLYISIITATILWGFSFIWTNDLIAMGVPIFIFIFLRMLLSGVIMLAFSTITSTLQKVARKDIKWMFLLAFFEPFVYFIGESYGLKITGSATLSAVIIATIPIFTMIMGRLLFNESLSRVNVAGIITAVLGIVLFVWNGSISSDNYYGILFLLLAVAGAVGYSSICKRLTGTYNAITITTWQFLFGAVLFFVPFVFWGLPQWTPRFLSSDVLKPIIALAVLCSSLSFVLYTKAIEVLGMTKAAIFTTMIPAVSAVAAYFLGQESFTTMQIIALAIALLGVVLSQLRKGFKII
ncbi:MAG: DMT family transporter [Bacteroidales bacterium]|jgi:drug/metabolite transporter (DMT)-like permease|nr:DMT family transporter [Bacteroidales bacterium]